MKTKLIAIITLLLIAFSTGWAWSDPGPYPVIFVHGSDSDADPDNGLWTWKATSAAMKEILDEGYADYQAGNPRDCKIKTTLNPTTGSPLERVRRIYNFSYYNYSNYIEGVIGNVGGQFYPVEKNHDIRSDYRRSANMACWAEHLADFIDDVLVATGADKVSLVCHSMGGLVARDAITFYGCEDKVYKVLMVGTPNHGFTGWAGFEIVSGLFAGWQDFQKHGEVLEMGVRMHLINGNTDFRNCEFPSFEYGWCDWLYIYDLVESEPGKVPQYGTIAGTKPRPITCFLPENDGLVPSSSVYLRFARFNYTDKQYHSVHAGDDYEDCLPTSEYTEEKIKQWILDYHLRPSIWTVQWLQLGGAQSAMSMIQGGGIAQWNAKVFFSFNETPGWNYNWYKGYRYIHPLPPYYIPWKQCAAWSNYDKQWFLDDSVYVTGNIGQWLVQAKQTYPGAYDTILTSPTYGEYAPEAPDPGGCPMLYSVQTVNPGTQAASFVQNNTLLPHSEHVSDTATDNMVLTSPPPVYDNHYYLNISENNTETSYFDQVKLYAVDHPEGTQVVTSEDGNTYVYSDEILANQAITWTSEILQDSVGNPVEYFYSLDHLDYVQHLDKYIWVGEDADSLFVSFPPIPADWTNVGLLVSVGPGRGILPDTSVFLRMGPDEGNIIDPIKKQYHTVYSGSGGGWIPRGKAYSRHFTSDWLIDVTPAAFMTEENEGVTFKIVASAENLAYVDRVALVKLETSGWSITEAQLDGAIHWWLDQGVPTDANITSTISYYDGMFAPKLEPDQQYALSFTSLPEDTTMSRDFVLQTHGVYGPPGFQLNLAPSGSDEDNSLPFEYNLELDQQILRSHVARISYQIPQAGRTTIEVIDVTGRRVTKLVDEQLNPGSYSINWNRTDDASRQVSTGVYFVRMVSGDFASNAKLVILK